MAGAPIVNKEVTLLASAARTALVTGADQFNHVARGVVITIDVTVDHATSSLTFTAQGKDSTSGKYYDLLVSAAVNAVGTTTLKIYPGLTAAANSVATDVLPVVWRLNVAVADAGSITYSVGAAYIL